VSVLVRVSLGFRDRVRVKVRVSFRLATFMYSVWPPVSLGVRVSLGIGFRDKVRVSVLVRVSFRLATFMYSVWPPVSVKVRVSLGIGLELRSGSVLYSPLSCILYVLLYPIFLTPNPKNFSVAF